MSNKYITIADSVPVRSRRFRVIMGGYKPAFLKRQTITETIGGGLDVAQGFVYHDHQYVIRVREQEIETDYGDKEDLEYFYQLNDPTPTSGSGSDLLTLIDHYGVTRHGYMVGDFVPEAVTTIIEGTEAWFLIPIELRLLPGN